MLMFAVSKGDLNLIFNDFLESVVPKLRTAKKKMKDKLLDHEFTDIKDYIGRTLMMNNQHISKMHQDLIDRKQKK